MSKPTTSILIVDDSALYRQALRNTLQTLSEVTIVGVAKNGREALEKIEQHDPDLLTLDVQMPDMDGIAVLREIKKRHLRPKAIMVSSFTREGAQITTDALLEGAFDFILKPSGGNPEDNRQRLKEELQSKIEAFHHHSRRRQRLSSRQAPNRIGGAPKEEEQIPQPQSQCQVVLIGISTGGPAALKAVLPKLPVDFPVPVLIVQHMSAQFTTSLARRLDELCELRVVEATDGMEVTAGTIYLAPGGHHLGVERRDLMIRAKLSDDPPENNCRPAVDFLFRSAANVWQGNTLGIIMTGMGRDGAKGCAELKAQGGYVFAQEEEGCVVFGMPKAVIEEGFADRQLPLGKIAPAIVRHVKRSRRQ